MTERQLRLLSEENLRSNERFSRLLSVEGALYTPEEIRDFAKDSGLDLSSAYLLLLAAALGAEEDRPWITRYLSPAVHLLKTEDFTKNEYRQSIRFPEMTKGRWQLARRAFAPYQLIPCGSMILTADGREIPRLGYFDSTFSYPAVLEGGREWMTVTPNEIRTMEADITAAHGKAAVLGLGLGYYLFQIIQKPEVTAVTVVERDPIVIELFKESLLPQFPQKEKITILQADAFDFLDEKPPVDFIFADLWHDVGDGLPLYLRLRKMERPHVSYRYWIEQDLLLFLRSLLLDDYLNRPGRLEQLLPDDPDGAWNALSLDHLRQLAPRISESDVSPN